MPLETLRKSITKEAEEKSAEIVKEAEKEASRIIREAEEQAKEMKKAADAEAEKEAQRLRKEGESGTEIEASSMLLEARDTATERALQKSLGRLRDELSKKTMKKVLDQGMKQFAELVGSGSAIVIKTAKQNADIVKGMGHKIEYTDIDGFIICSPDGKIALNATVSSIIEGQAENARRIIGAELFGERASEPRSSAKAPVRVSRPRKGRISAAKKSKRR
jgi:V/A-type H+-transporting ATPase subunit E